ncbi:MAG: hypothetical protein ACRERV_04470 [Methylococcales bacterium]
MKWHVNASDSFPVIRLLPELAVSSVIAEVFIEVGAVAFFKFIDIDFAPTHLKQGVKLLVRYLVDNIAEAVAAALYGVDQASGQ